MNTSIIPDYFQQACQVGLKDRLTSGPDNRGSTALLSSVLWSPMRFSLVTTLFEDSTPFSSPWTSLYFLFKVGSLISETQKTKNDHKGARYLTSSIFPSGCVQDLGNTKFKMSLDSFSQNNQLPVIYFLFQLLYKLLLNDHDYNHSATIQFIFKMILLMKITVYKQVNHMKTIWAIPQSGKVPHE